MRKTTTIRDRIAVRAYFMWLDGHVGGAEAHWLDAEKIEKAYAERRAASATKAAVTRRAKAPASIVAAPKAKRLAPSLRQ